MTTSGSVDRPGLAVEIAIVGAGFSGTACALALHGADPSVRIRLFDRSGRYGPGLAYGTPSTLHLLNVPAPVLGVDASRPEGFQAWLESQRGSPAAFQPRIYYGHYLTECLAAAAMRPNLECVPSAVIDLQRADDGFTLATSEGGTYRADAVVLATGHARPGGARRLSPDARTAERILLAWRDLAKIAALPVNARVFCIGSGLTMLDMALSALGERGARQLIALSSRGLLPRPHTITPGPGALGAELVSALEAAPARIRARVTVFRHFVRAHADQLDWRDAITAVRPHLPRLWRELAHAERARFLRHARSHWEVHRHRCAPEVAARIDAWRAADRLVVIAGRIENIVAGTDGFTIRYRERGSTTARDLHTDAVIDATPASTDMARIEDPLIQHLTAAGLLRGDALGLGLEADLSGKPLDADGRPVPGLFYVGPWLRARDWEATAVTELRTNAAATARALLAELQRRPPQPARR